VEEAAAPSATLAAVLIGGGLGMLILIPSLWYLLLLRFRGSLDKDTPVLSAGRDRA
jgi:hypothetical protein